MDTMQLAGWVAAAIRECNPAQVYVDEIGVGAGVVDRLRELGTRCAASTWPTRRARMACSSTSAPRATGPCGSGSFPGSIRIPADNQLVGELAALRYGYDSQGRIKMESKDDIRKRGLPSPDKADALMLAFLAPSSRLRLWV